MRHVRSSFVIAITALIFVFGCNGCATTGTGAGGNPPAPKADATIAVNARAAIDSVEALHVAACSLAIEQHKQGKLDDAKYQQIYVACDGVAAAEQIANTQLSVYLATGTLDAQRALSDSVSAIMLAWTKLDALKKGG